MLTDRKPRRNLVGCPPFGFLEVIEWVGHNGKGKHFWKCLCKCGKYITTYTHKLTSGSTKSCGCYRASIPRQKWWKGVGTMSGKFWSNVRRAAMKRNIVFDITPEYAWNLFLKQDQKCVLSGLSINFGKNSKSINTASLDRINSSKGYTIDNVQWVHKDINIMKNSYSQEYFIEMCKKVVNQHVAFSI